MTVRVYVPLTSSQVAAFVADERLAGPVSAHAVTADLRAAWPEADEEQAEYAATYAAADESWAARAAGDAPRRFVLAVDVAPERVTETGGTGVTVEGDLTRRTTAALQADPEDLAEDIAEADLEDAELGWFATQEIADAIAR